MSVQCLGTTRAGTRCSRKVNSGKYCHQHVSQDLQDLSKTNARPTAKYVPFRGSPKDAKPPLKLNSPLKAVNNAKPPAKLATHAGNPLTTHTSSYKFGPFSPQPTPSNNLSPKKLLSPTSIYGSKSAPKYPSPTTPLKTPSKSPPKSPRTVDYTKPGYIYVYTLASLLDNSKDGWLKTRNLLSESKDKDRWVTFKSKSLLLILVKVGMTTQTVAKRIQQWESKCQHKLVCLHPEYNIPGAQSGSFLERFRGLTLSAQKTSAQFRQYTTFQDNIKGFFVPRDVLRAEKEIHDELKRKFGRGDVYCTGCVEKAKAKHKGSSFFDLFRKKDFMQSDYNVHVEWFPVPKNRMHEVYKIIDRICLRYLP